MGEESGKPPALPGTSCTTFHQGQDLRTPTGAGGEGARATAPQQPLPSPLGSRPSSAGEEQSAEQGCKPPRLGEGSGKQACPWPHLPHLPQSQSPRSPQSDLRSGVQRRSLALRWVEVRSMVTEAI